VTKFKPFNRHVLGVLTLRVRVQNFYTRPQSASGFLAKGSAPIQKQSRFSGALLLLLSTAVAGETNALGANLLAVSNPAGGKRDKNS
jgi:hypothetical protein